MNYRKKLIEVALPLDIINKASIREKSIRHGHPSTLHLWWSRKPLATCRAILFASLVDDPSSHEELFKNEEDQQRERQRLFDLIEKLVKWENSNNKDVLGEALDEIKKSNGGSLPPTLDPFCGGGSIPLEAQRLGLEAYGADLNPVAVLISKALIEIPPKFAGLPAVNPNTQKTFLERDWPGAQGLAEDIRYYGKWMRDEAERRIGHLYPKVTLSKDYGSQEATVIAWLWMRTVTCANPACRTQMPLTSKWWLSKKTGKEAWVEPQIDNSVTPPTIHFVVKTGHGEPQDGTVNRQGARCIACGTPVPFDHIRSEGKAGRMSSQLVAIVAEGQHGRVYFSPNEDQTTTAAQAKPEWKPEVPLPQNPRNFNTPIYGLNTYDKLFTLRQLVALTTFSDLVREVREKVLHDANSAGWSVDGASLNTDGKGANAYADAVATYLAISVDRLADRNSTICSWDVTRDSTRNTFARQAIPMVWDYAEANPFSESSGNFQGTIDWVAEVIAASPCNKPGVIRQRDATEIINGIKHPLISTDPPYYDNIGYADLSDFFYIWLRRSLKDIYSELFDTPLVPKERELVATPYRFGGDKKKAQEYFEEGLKKVFDLMSQTHDPKNPFTVYYAFKQSESENEDEDGVSSKSKKGGSRVTASTGWETMLEGLINSGFMITGTWPLRTEMMNRSVGQGTNALASSIVLVCRPRQKAPLASRRDFIKALRVELPDALKALQHIGPGMAIYSRYSKVIESDGTPLRVRTALQLINRTLDEVLAEQEGEYDAETRWAVAWFEEYAMNTGEFGRAETLSKAKNATLQSLVDAGLLEAKAGKVRLLNREELSQGWKPNAHSRLTVWEIMQRIIHALLEGKGEEGASIILRQAGTQAEAARDLAYRLYSVCERKGWAQEALVYNSLVTSWSEISQLARNVNDVQQMTLIN